MKKRSVLQIFIVFAVIFGSLWLTSPVQASRDNLIQQSRIVLPDLSEFEIPIALQQQEISAGIEWALMFLRKLAALVLLGLLSVWLLPSFLDHSIEKFADRPWASLGVGSLIFIIFPIAILIGAGVIALIVFLFSLATLSHLAVWVALSGGAVIFTTVILFGLIITFLAKILAGLWLGRLIISLINKDWAKKDWLCFLVGVFLITLLINIPWVGWLLSFITDLFTLGTLWFAVIKKEAANA